MYRNHQPHPHVYSTSKTAKRLLSSSGDVLVDQLQRHLPSGKHGGRGQRLVQPLASVQGRADGTLFEPKTAWW